MKKTGKSQTRQTCSECTQRSDNYFCSLSQNTQEIFDSIKTTQNFQKGDVLFVEGQSSSSVYLICQGKIKLSTCSKDGKIIILHIAEAGELLGLSALVTDGVHVATAEILESSQVHVVRNESFLEFLQHNTDACLSAVRQLGKNYNTAYLQICSLGLSSSVSDKLASLFLDWCKSAVPASDGLHVRVAFTHEEIAEMIGTSRETVSRLFKEFKDNQLVSRKGSDIIIHDKTNLENMIGTKSRSRLRLCEQI